jgi:hypothetical protein
VNGEPNEKRVGGKAGLARFSPIQLAIAGLACGLIVVILVLIASVLIRSS